MIVRDPKLLAQFMAHQHLSVRKMARLAGVSRSTIGHLRSGKRAVIDDALAGRVQELLGAPDGLLFAADTTSTTHDVGSAA